MSRPILETHESRLKTVLKIEETQSLPQDVQDLYWQCERISRKIGRGGVSDDTLVLIAVLSGALSEQPEETFLDLARTLDRGEPVEVKWRNEWISAEYIGIKKNKIRVIVAGDIEPNREFEPSQVRLPDEEVILAE